MLEYIQKAWNIFTKNSLTFIVAQLIALIIPGIFAFIGILVFVGTFLGSVGLPSIESLATEEMIKQYVLGIVSNANNISLLFHAIGYGLIFFLISIILSMFLEIGVYGMAIESFRKKTRIKTMFKAARKYGLTVIGCSIIKFLIMFGLLILSVLMGVISLGIGLLIGILAMILISVLFSLTSPAILDNHGAIGAIKKSVHVAKKNYLSILGLIIIFALISIVVSWIPWIGFLRFLIASLIIAPLQKITFAGFYIKNRR